MRDLVWFLLAACVRRACVTKGIPLQWFAVSLIGIKMQEHLCRLERIPFKNKLYWSVLHPRRPSQSQSSLVARCGRSTGGDAAMAVVAWRSGSRPACDWRAMTQALGMLALFLGAPCHAVSRRVRVLIGYGVYEVTPCHGVSRRVAVGH